MKRNVNYLILFVLLILPASVYALTGSVSLDCALNEAKAGDEILCNVDGSSLPTGITQFNAYLELGEGLNFKDQRESGEDEAKYIVLKNSWQGDTDLTVNPDKPDVNIGLFRANVTNTSFSIFSFIVVVSENATVGDKTVTLSNVHFRYDSDDAETENVSIDGASTSISVFVEEEAEDNPDLGELYVNSGGVMSPIFSKDNLTYAIRLDSADTSKFTMRVVAEDDKYSIVAKNTDTNETIDLSKDIVFAPSEDSKTMSIKITVSYNDKVKEYVLIIDRPKPTTVGEPTLASLVVGGVSVNLNSCGYDCEVKLSKEVLKSYKIFATLTDEENFKFSDYTKSILDTEKSDSYPFEIQIVPKNADSGYGSITYIITIVTDDSATGTEDKTNQSGGSENVSHNPGTGSASGIVMGIVLILSFIGSIYYYRRNISEYQ